MHYPPAIHTFSMRKFELLAALHLRPLHVGVKPCM
jgi:hypothetical protein